jgi:hypothetical protein
VAAGKLSFVNMGRGTERALRRFDPDDIDAFNNRDGLSPQQRAELEQVREAMEMVAEERRRRRAETANIVRMPKRGRRKQYVYFIRSGDCVKIGVATNPRARFSSLQVAHPSDLELLAVTSGGEAREKILHRRFQHLAVRGEWFRLEGDLVEYIADLKARAVAQPASNGLEA